MVPYQYHKIAQESVSGAPSTLQWGHLLDRE